MFYSHKNDFQIIILDKVLQHLEKQLWLFSIKIALDRYCNWVFEWVLTFELEEVLAVDTLSVDETDLD